MRSGTANGNQYYPAWTAVHQLTTKRRRDANQVARTKFMVFLPDDPREAALQHEKQLLLALVRVDPSALSRLEHQSGDDGYSEPVYYYVRGRRQRKPSTADWTPLHGLRGRRPAAWIVGLLLFIGLLLALVIGLFAGSGGSGHHSHPGRTAPHVRTAPAHP